LGLKSKWIRSKRRTTCICGLGSTFEMMQQQCNFLCPAGASTRSARALLPLCKLLLSISAEYLRKNLSGKYSCELQCVLFGHIVTGNRFLPVITTANIMVAHKKCRGRVFPDVTRKMLWMFSRPQPLAGALDSSLLRYSLLLCLKSRTQLARGHQGADGLLL